VKVRCGLYLDVCVCVCVCACVCVRVRVCVCACVCVSGGKLSQIRGRRGHACDLRVARLKEQFGWAPFLEHVYHFECTYTILSARTKSKEGPHCIEELPKGDALEMCDTHFVYYTFARNTHLRLEKKVRNVTGSICATGTADDIDSLTHS